MREIRPLASLKRTALKRKPGYLEECLRLGTLDDAGMVHFTPENWIKIRLNFRLDDAKKTGAFSGFEQQKAGLGDMLHEKLGPIGRDIKWPCMKGDGTTNLKPNSPCDKARKAANAVGKIFGIG